MADRNSSDQLTTSQKIQQFKDYYLGGTLAALAVAAVIIFMVARFLSPASEPVLRIAVFDTELSAGAQEELAQALRDSLGLKDDAEIVIDSGFTSANTNEYSRLTILAADGMVDVVIAGEEAFAEMAGYGYFKDLSLYLPEDMQKEYAGSLRDFAYRSDALAEDAQQNGEMASGEYPFGLSLTGSGLWGTVTADSSVKPENPVLGVVLESENDSNVIGFVRAAME